MPDWDADQYLKFAGQRTRPALDLAARIPLAEPADVLTWAAAPETAPRCWPPAIPGRGSWGSTAPPK